MSEAALLRVLADRLDELDGLTLFPDAITDPGPVTVEWSNGSDHPGYAALSKAIGAVVEQHWNALRVQVLKKKEGEVQSARASWNEMNVEPALEAEETDEDTLPGNGNSVPQQFSRVQMFAQRG